MTVCVLQSKTEIYAARRELRRRGISCIGWWPPVLLLRVLRKLEWTQYIKVGDPVKSWDILQTVEFVQAHVPPDAPILDLGAYASEILGVLHRLNYARLAGVDLNPRLEHMPFGDNIRYEIADFMQTPFADGSFKAITAISVIEHGFQSARLLSEVSRLLCPGGYLIASFDFWPDRIDTRGIELYGMDWRIFSTDQVEAFIAEAATHGLMPVGAIDLHAGSPTKELAGKQYTFAWMALHKTARAG